MVRWLRIQLTLQDVLAATACVAVAAAALRVALSVARERPSGVGLGIAALLCWIVLLPNACGGAVGCLLAGWRQAWRYALLALLLLLGLLAMFWTSDQVRLELKRRFGIAQDERAPSHNAAERCSTARKYAWQDSNLRPTV